MFMKSIWIGFIGVMLFVASASAASSVLQGIVKDANGHPIQGADIRIGFRRWTTSVATTPAPPGVLTISGAVEKYRESLFPFAARCAKWVMTNS